MITKTCTDIIREAALAEDFNVTDMISDELQANYNDCIKNMPIIPKELVGYSRDMVPVFTNESNYFVELDNVVKYMNSAEITDVKEAMENIAEANNLHLEQLSLVIESKDYMEAVLEEAIELSRLGDKSLLENCELSIKLINLLESEGISVVLTEGKLKDGIEKIKKDNAKKLKELKKKKDLKVKELKDKIKK